jgi:biopolymer transport protein ExbD
LAVGVGGESLALPQIRSATAGAGPASVVVSYRREDVILFEGGMYTLAELRPQMAAYAQKHPNAVMLVRTDREVSVQHFLNLCEMAKEVGFANVLVAAEQSPATGNR